MDRLRRPLRRDCGGRRGDLGRLFGQIKREQGRFDIVFANAGVSKECCTDAARALHQKKEASRATRPH